MAGPGPWLSPPADATRRGVGRGGRSRGPERPGLRWCFFSPGFRSLDVLLGDSRTSGGAEAQIARLAAALAQAGHEVGLIYGDGAGRAPPRRVAGVVCLDAAPSWRRPASLRGFWRAMSLLAPDVLYARLPGDFLWIMGLFARLRPGARFVYALAHDDHADPRTACGHRRWLHAPLYALGLHGAHAIAAQHESQAAALAPSLRSRAACVPNLVRSAAEAPRPWGDAEFDAAWIAQIRPEKRLDLFLDLAESLPRLRFAVVGGFDVTTDPAGRAALESRAAALPNVTMLGPLRADGVMGVLKRSRTLVNTSDSEGFPNTMLEAWSVGVPVLSLAVDPGGVIAREELGRVSRSGSRLWADLSELARDEALNRRLGSRAMAYVRRRHGFEEVVGALTGPLREGAVRSAPA